MKNISKRVLVILMAGLLLASCGNTEVPSESIESVSETASETVSETELTDGIPPTDMDGYTLNILNYSENNPNYNWSLYQIDATELSGSPVNDAIFNRNLEVETRFNAEIQEIPCDNTQTSVPIDVQAGDTNYQIAMIWDNKVTNLLTQGILQMWNDMPGINLDNPWWNADANNAYSYKNQQYAVIGDFNLSEYSKSYVVFLNKNLYASLHSVEDLYTLIQDGG